MIGPGGRFGGGRIEKTVAGRYKVGRKRIGGPTQEDRKPGGWPGPVTLNLSNPWVREHKI